MSSCLFFLLLAFDFHKALEEDSILAKDDLSIHERLSSLGGMQEAMVPSTLQLGSEVGLQGERGHVTVRAASETDPQLPVVHRHGQHHLWGDHNLLGLSPSV